MSARGKLLTASLVVAAAIIGFMAIGGALCRVALMLLLAWILVMLLRERARRGRRPGSGGS